MGRLKCFLLLAVATATLVKADDGWKRLMELNTAQESRSAQWARSSNGGNRVPFVPEDIAMPPPWLLPHQQPQVAFPVAQAQVRSFFDEEVVDWPPRSPKIASGKSHHPPEPSQRQQPPPPLIHTTLQPPRRQWTESPIRPVQHVWLESDRQQSTSQRPQTAPKKATSLKLRDLAEPVTHQVVDLKKLPAPVEPEEPYQAGPANEPKPEPKRRQNKQQQPTANRKSVMSSYDSSEYDYDDVSSGHQEKRITNAKSDHDELDSGDQGFYDESPSLTEVDATMSVSGGREDFYAKTAAPPPPPPPLRRQQTVQPFQPPESRRNQPQVQPTSVEEADVEQHQAFDYSKTIFRTPVNSGQNGRQQQQHAFPALHEPVQQRENGRPSTYGDEPTETERQQQSAKAKQGQQQQQPLPAVRRPAQQQQRQQQQQQQQQPSERNASPADMAVFEAERPSFHSPNLQASPPNQQQRQFEVGQHHHQRQQVPAQQQQQQQVGDWPPRHPAVDSNRKNKPRINPAHHPEEHQQQQQQQPADNFGIVPRYKPKNPAVQSVPQQYQEEREDLPDLQPPYHHQPPPYRPEEIGLNYDQLEEPERPLKEHHRPQEHHQPIYDYQDGQQHGPKSHRPRRPPPTEARPAPEFDPASQSNPWSQHNNQQPEENAYDPYGQPNADPYREHEQHQVQAHEQEAQEPHQPQEHQTEGPLPLAPAPGRRPPGARPPFQSGERFNGADHDDKGNNNDGDFDSPGPFKAPPPQRPHHPQSNNRQRPHRPPPTHQRPKDASLVTQGLNTLKTLVGLQTAQQQRPQRPHHSFNRPGGPRPQGDRRRPPQHQQGNNFDNNNGGEIGRQDQDASEEFGPSDLNNFPVQARHNVQPTVDEPMEHRGIPDDDEIQDLIPPSVSTTESLPTRVTSPSTRPPTRPPTEAPEIPVPVSSTAAPEETKSTLFPPFNKRVRPQPPSPAQTENKANAGKDSPAGQLRITSYKQRIEAMKERAKLREQLAQSKKDTEGTVEQAPEPVGPVSVTSTSTTTARPSTTRPKIPPRMPVRRPVTSGPPSSTSSSTTESVPLMEKVDKVPESKESSTYDQYKRRFKPKPSFSRPSPKEEELVAPPSEDVAAAKSDVLEEDPSSSSRKNLFGKMPGSPFVRRRIQQKQQREEEERLLSEESSKGPVVHKESASKEEMPAVPAGPPPRPNKRIRPGQFARTTTVAPIVEPSLDDQDEPASSVLASPDQWPPTSEPHTPVKAETSVGLTPQEEEESPRIDLVSVAPAPPANEESENHQPQHQPSAGEEPEEFPTHQQQPPPFAFESSGQPFLDKPDVSSERMGIEAEEEPEPVQVQEKPRHSFFTMATNDPILPIEELLNIRVRDNGKDM